MLKQLAKSTLRNLGYELRRYCAPAPVELSRLEFFFDIARRNSAVPTFIIDVGANRGGWTRIALNYFPDAQYLLVEPQEALEAYSEDLLLKPNVRWLTAGVSDEGGDLMLTLPPRDDSATFTVTAEEADRQGLIQVRVPVFTLDELVEKEVRIPEMVKIDAEGFDLRALRGASKLLGVTEVFFVECAVCCRALENTLEAVCGFMKENGYRAVDITDLNRSPRHGVLWLAEVVFLREASPLWANFGSYE